jgi:large subunit ribosomal protein L16
VKYRKVHRGERRGKAQSGNTVSFGEFGLQAQQAAWVTARVYPDKPVTKKPAETRMGSGKGAPDHWVAVVRPGRMLFEISGIKERMAREAMHLASYKLPIATRFVAKETVKEEARVENR